MTTRETKRTYDEHGDYVETETASLSSVELKEDAKGAVRVESYKVYGADPAEAERQALAGMMRLRGLIAEATDAKLTAQLEASLGRKP